MQPARLCRPRRGAPSRAGELNADRQHRRRTGALTLHKVIESVSTLPQTSGAADNILDREAHPADPAEPAQPPCELPCDPALPPGHADQPGPRLAGVAEPSQAACCFPRVSLFRARSHPLALPGVAAPQVPCPWGLGNWGVPSSDPAPRGSAGEIPRDPVRPPRQGAASLVSTTNLARGSYRVKPAAALRRVKTRALRATQRAPLLQPISSQGARAQSSNTTRQIPATAERGACSCQHRPRTEPARCPPQAAHSQLHATAPRCPPLLTQPTDIQNTRPGFSDRSHNAGSSPRATEPGLSAQSFRG